MRFGGLLETKVKEGNAQGIVDKVFNGWSYISNYEHNRLGRIWIVQNDMVRMTPIYKMDQLLFVLILLEGTSEEFLCTFFLRIKHNGGEEESMG